MKSLTVALFALVVGCVAEPGDPDPGATDGKGDQFGSTGGAPTWFTFPWLWANETAAELTRPLGTLEGNPLIVQRLQYWVDEVDARLRAKFPMAMKNTPKPNIYVTTRRDFLLGSLNAAVHPAAMCIPMPVTLETPGSQPQNVVGFFTNGLVGSLAKCLVRDTVKAQVPEIVGFYNFGSQFCKVKKIGESLKLGKDCLYDIEFTGGPRSGMSSAYTATSSWIEVQKGLIKASTSEESLLFVLFHELGHYYRTHLSTPSDRLNYFYHLDAVAPGTKPSADPTLADLTNLVRKRMQQNASSKLKSGFADANQRVVGERLGFYTIEEEADKFSLELLAMMGMNPTLAEQTILTLGAQWEAERGGPKPGEIPAATCQALASNNWKDPQGNDVVVPLGDLADLHHSPCFRAFNMGREIKGRPFTVDTSVHPTPPGSDWAAVQASF